MARGALLLVKCLQQVATLSTKQQDLDNQTTKHCQNILLKMTDAEPILPVGF